MTILLREVSSTQDLALILAWRNLPEVSKGSYTQAHKGLTPWEEHYKWHTDRHHWKRFIIELGENEIIRPVGYFYIAQLDSWSPEIGYAVGEPLLWGKGIGREAVYLGLQWLREHGYKYVHATVLKANQRSLRLLQSLGFVIISDAREGEWFVQVKL